jgi:hypothetical protein
MINKEQYNQFEVPDGSTIPYVTYAQIMNAHTEQEFINFTKWMYGQTGLLLSNGDIGIYSWDYERWVRQNCEPAQRSGDWD